MARMTVDDIVQTAWQASGRPDENELSRQQILSYANRVLGDLTINYNFAELQKVMTITTANGTVGYAFTETDVQKLKSGHVVSPWQRCREINMERWEKLQGGSAAIVGVPRYFLVGYDPDISTTVNSLSFTPTPNGVYVVKIPFKRRHPELLLDGSDQTLLIPEEWDLWLSDKVTIRCLVHLEKYEGAKAVAQALNQDTDKKHSKQKPKSYPWVRPISGMRTARG